MPEEVTAFLNNEDAVKTLNAFILISGSIIWFVFGFIPWSQKRGKDE